MFIASLNVCLYIVLSGSSYFVCATLVFNFVLSGKLQWKVSNFKNAIWTWMMEIQINNSEEEEHSEDLCKTWAHT